jgi:hypothetical protein
VGEGEEEWARTVFERCRRTGRVERGMLWVLGAAGEAAARGVCVLGHALNVTPCRLQHLPVHLLQRNARGDISAGMHKG